MQVTLITAGIVFVAAAIVGGGLKAFNVEIPGLESRERRLGLGAFGLILLVIGFAFVDSTKASDSEEAGGTTTTTVRENRTNDQDSTTTAQTTVEVPDLLEKHIGEAMALLEDPGLEIGELDRRRSNVDPPGTIIAQSVPPGTRVEIGTSVDLIVTTMRVEDENLIWHEEDPGIDFDSFETSGRGIDLVVATRPNPDATEFTRFIEPTEDVDLAYVDPFETGFYSGLLSSCEEALRAELLTSLPEEDVEVGARLCIRTDEARIVEMAVRHIEGPGGPFVLEYDLFVWTLR